MRGGIARHSLIIAIALSAAACGGKDKGEKAAGNATGNETAAGSQATPAVDDAAARAGARKKKVKDFNDKKGGCDKCQPTEAKVAAQMKVPHGLRPSPATPSCMNEARDTAEIREVSDDAAA